MNRFALIAGLAVSTVAWAHAADIIAVGVAPESQGLREQVTLTDATLLKLAPVDGDHDGLVSAAELEAGAEAVKAGLWLQMPLTVGTQVCQVTPERSHVENGVVSLVARAQCPPGAVRQDFRVLSVLPAGYRVDVTQQVGAELKTRSVQGQLTSLEVLSARETPEPSAPASPLWLALVMLVCVSLGSALVPAIQKGMTGPLLVGLALLVLSRVTNPQQVDGGVWATAFTWVPLGLTLAFLLRDRGLVAQQLTSLTAVPAAALLSAASVHPGVIVGALVPAFALQTWPRDVTARRRLALAVLVIAWGAAGFQLAGRWVP